MKDSALVELLVTIVAAIGSYFVGRNQRRKQE